MSKQPWGVDLPMVDTNLPSLKLTAKAPTHGWLEYDPFLLGKTAYFQGRTVSFREGDLVPNSLSLSFWVSTDFSDVKKRKKRPVGFGVSTKIGKSQGHTLPYAIEWY